MRAPQLERSRMSSPRPWAPLALALLLLSACQEAETVAPARPIEAIAAYHDDVVERITVIGRLQADLQARVNPELPERIEKVHVVLGQQVRAGDPLVMLSGDLQAAGLGQARASLEAAEAARELAQNQLERIRIVYEAGTASRAELDAAESQLRSAEAQVRQLRQALSQAAVQSGRSVMSAPFDGVVAQLDAEEGDIAAPGRPLVVVVQPGGMKAKLDVPERSFFRVQTGMPAVIQPLADREQVVEGVVSAVGALIDPTTRTGRVEVAVSDPEGALVAGAAVRATIELDRREGVLLVPIQAVQLAADVHLSRKGTVYVIEDDVAHAREVVVGHREPERIEIIEGLEPGEVVATFGAHLLRDGARVSVQEAP